MSNAPGQPHYYYPQPQPATPPWLVVALLALIVFVLIDNGILVNPWKGQQDQSDVIDKDKESTPSNLNGAWIVLVEETKSRPVARQKVLDDFRFWQSLQEQGLAGWRRYDPDSNAAKQFIERAQAEGVGEPFAMLIDVNGTCLHVIPFPDSTDAIKAMLK